MPALLPACHTAIFFRSSKDGVSRHPVPEGWAAPGKGEQDICLQIP